MRETDLLIDLRKELDKSLSDKDIESDFITEKINQIKNYSLKNVKASIDELISEIVYPLTIAVEGEQEHGCVRVLDCLLDMDSCFTNKVEEIEKQTNNNILRLTFIKDKNDIEFRRVGSASNSSLLLDNKSTVPSKSGGIFSTMNSLVNKAVNKKAEYFVTMPVFRNNSLHRKLSENNVEIVLFPGRKESENDAYKGKIDLIIAVVDNRKTNSKDKIISDAIEENHVGVYPVIIKENINDDTRAVFDNIPELKGNGNIIEIAKDDNSQIIKLRSMIEEFIDTNSCNSLPEIFRSSFQYRQFKIRKAGESFVKAMNSFMIEINNLRTDVVFDTYDIFYKWDQNTVRNNKKIRKQVESYYKSVLKELNSRLKKAHDVEQLSSIVEDLTSDEYLFCKEFNLMTELQGEFDKLKDERKKVLLKGAGKLKIKKSNLSMQEILEGVFKGSRRLRIDTNILRTDVLSREVERNRDAICSPLISGSILNPQWVQMHAKKNKLKECIGFLQVDAIIDNLSAVIVRNIQQIKDAVNAKISEYTEHGNDVDKVITLQKTIYASLDVVRKCFIDSPAIPVALLPSEDTITEHATSKMQEVIMNVC